MYSYISTTLCEDEDHASVLALSLRSIPHVNVEQHGASVFVSLDHGADLKEVELENIFLKMERIIKVFTSIPFTGRV